MHFHVLGIGSIGSLLAFHLRRVLPKSHTITLIHKNASQAKAATSQGVRFERQGIVTTEHGFQSVTFSELGPPGEKIESLFVTTKAYHTVNAVRLLVPRLSPRSTIVLVHNGMGVYEQLVREIFLNPQQRPHFILSSNTHGVFRKDPFPLFVHTGVGDLTFGIIPDPAQRSFEAGFEDQNVPLEERRPRLSDITTIQNDPEYERYRSLRATVAALLLLEPLNVSWRSISDVQILMRRKLVANVVINSLTALMGCRNGDIFKTESALRIMRRVCREASYVFAAQLNSDSHAHRSELAAQGIDVESIPAQRLPPGLSEESLQAEVLRVAELTRGNISSMLMDIRKGRRTEVDFIHGYLLKLAAAYTIRMPTIDVLSNLVRMRGAIPIDQML